MRVTYTTQLVFHNLIILTAGEQQTQIINLSTTRSRVTFRKILIVYGEDLTIGPNPELQHQTLLAVRG
jgi:hypothetical protein